MLLVVFVFLQSWRATLIPLVTVPVSLIGAFAVFPLLGFSVNTLSLFGLVLAIGLVVDDAIVVVEAVEHHIEHGMSPRDATVRAMKEVTGPVVAIAVILAAVFIPVAFIGGVTGRLYQQFALTIAISVLISAFNALTLAPRSAPCCSNRVSPAVCSERLSGTSIAASKRPPTAMWTSRAAWRAGIHPARLLGRLHRRRRAHRPKLPTGFVPDEDQGICTSTCSCPTPRRSSAPTKFAKRLKAFSLRPRASRATAPSRGSA